MYKGSKKKTADNFILENPLLTIAQGISSSRSEEVFEENPVDIQEFIESRKFLNQKWNGRTGCRPIIMQILIEITKNNIREVTGYLTANSFNLWSLVYGLSPISDSTKILGIPAFRLGEILYLILTSFVIFKVKVKDHKSILYSFLILSLGAFLILTKMHERYYFLTFIFLALLSGVDKKLRKIYYLCSLLFFINLYHFWWMPKFAFLIDILSQNLVEKLLAILNILLFFSLLKYYVGIPKAINRENLYNKFKWIRNSS